MVGDSIDPTEIHDLSEAPSSPVVTHVKSVALTPKIEKQYEDVASTLKS